jgi:pimeloyl-ACP methyl ester carboxylesterase
MRILATALLVLVLTACVPVVDGVGDDAVIPGARVASAPFGDLVTGYEVLGSGPPVVMVHGIGGGSSVFQYRRNAPAVAAAGYRVYALDLLGFGRSSRPQQRTVQDDLVAQVTSFLEDVSASPRCSWPTACRRRTPSASPPSAPTWSPGSRSSRPPGTAASTGPKTPRASAPSTSSPTRWSARSSPACSSTRARSASSCSTPTTTPTASPRRCSPPTTATSVRGRALDRLLVRQRQPRPGRLRALARHRQPALLVWGTAPGFSSYADAEDFVLARPDAHLVLLRDAALLPNEERADAFNEVLIGFLERTLR